MNQYDKAMAAIKAEHEIVHCLYNYIDRMNDVTDEDPLDKISGEFLKKVNPLIQKHLKALGW